MLNEAFYRNDSNLAQECMEKWKNLVDQWWKKYNKSGSAGTPIVKVCPLGAVSGLLYVKYSSGYGIVSKVRSSFV